jgi:hypothetical protein
VPPISVQLPRFSLFEFPLVTLHGFRLFEYEGCLFTDQSLVDETQDADIAFWSKIAGGQSEDLVFEPDGTVRSRSGETLRIDGSNCLVLCSDEPSNFGSWIYRVLPKFLLARMHGPFERVFVYQNSSWMLPILRLVCASVESVPHWPTRSYVIENATIASLPTPGVCFRGELRDALRELAGCCVAPPARMEKVYISRRKQAIARPGFRVLENETELVERLRSLGFQEFFPEDHTIEHQIAVLSNARLIVSTGGSNLFGCVFAMAADMIIDIESGPEWAYAHMNLLASTGRPFSMVRSVRQKRGTGVHLNWTVDVDAFVEGIRRLAIC